MSQQFFVRRGNQEQGPLTPDQLKQLVSSGQLATTDLVRTAEKPDWRQAGTVKGLFPPTNPSTSIPPPPPPHSAKAPVPPVVPSPPNAASTVQSGLTDLLSTAKQAKDLAAAHARKTQINQMILPKAFLALGKEIFESGRFQEQFADLFQRITAVSDETARVAATDKDRPQATDLKGKLQAGAAHLMAQGQGAKLGLQRDSLLRELGLKAFETHGPTAGSEAVVAEITQAHAEIVRLEEQIGRLSAASREKLLTPGRLLIVGGVAAAVMVMLLLVVVAAASKAGRSGGGGTQATALKDVMQSESPDKFVGKQVLVTGRQVSVTESGGGKHRLVIHTPQGYALCELHTDHVKRAYGQSGEMTVIGKFAGINDGDIELTECRFTDAADVAVTKPDPARIASKDDFIAAFRRLGGQITPAIRDSRGEFFGDGPQCHPTLGSEISYDDWTNTFGEPSRIRNRSADDPVKHEWTQQIGSFRCRVCGVIFTPTTYEPWKRAGGYENRRSEWKIHVRAVCFD